MPVASWIMKQHLVDFAVKLQRQQLTPGQEQLRQRLQNLAERMFDEAVDWCWDDDTDLFYQVISQSEEQRNSRDA
ncbi:hypothetical protein MMC07_006439 [Pseudocyphellaria aurata]|nr:hypothetical protein [Pseudocyphellaria aurata]